MKNKMTFLYIGLAVLLFVTGVVVYKAVFTKNAPTPVDEEEIVELLPEVDASIVVSAVLSSSKPHTVVVTAEGLAGKYASVAYELTYESQGLIKGVNSGSKPIETVGKDTFEREIYLGTCSRNVCKPDTGVTKVSVVLEFTGTDGKRSQFSKEYEL